VVPAAAVDGALERLIRNAVDEVLDTAGHGANALGAAVRQWAIRLADGEEPAALFIADWRYPMLQLPWWIEPSVRGARDLEFQRALARSTVAGYYFIRLVDNAVDAHGSNRALLAAGGILFSTFQQPYQTYFPPAHDFWIHFRSAWQAGAEAVYREARLGDQPLDDEAFQTIAAPKVAAATIPVGAVLLRAGRGDRLPAWLRVCELLACHEQMLDDLFDWLRDLKARRPTRLLTEALARGRTRDGAVAWFLSEGVSWALQRMQQWRAAMRDAVLRLECPEFLGFLDRRAELIEQWEASWRPGLATLSKLDEAFPAGGPAPEVAR
jgi:hypothetical protein